MQFCRKNSTANKTAVTKSTTTIAILRSETTIAILRSKSIAVTNLKQQLQLQHLRPIKSETNAVKKSKTNAVTKSKIIAVKKYKTFVFGEKKPPREIKATF